MPIALAYIIPHAFPAVLQSMRGHNPWASRGMNAMQDEGRVRLQRLDPTRHPYTEVYTSINWTKHDEFDASDNMQIGLAKALMENAIYSLEDMLYTALATYDDFNLIVSDQYRFHLGTVHEATEAMVFRANIYCVCAAEVFDV